MVDRDKHFDLEQMKNWLEELDDLVDEESNKHLERCEYCQKRLAAVAADESCWADAQSILGSTFHQWDLTTGQTPSVSGLETTPVREKIGHYQVEAVIGSGGMGTVYKAVDPHLKRNVAVKVLGGRIKPDNTSRSRFLKEAQLAASIVHDNIVAVHGVEHEGDQPFLVMQYIAGESLQQHVERSGPLNPKTVIEYGQQIAKGLSAAHQRGLVHRDIKPANILIEKLTGRVRITDFGLARMVNESSMTQSGMIIGTPYYMSPEQATSRAVDSRADLFSLGSVLYFLCTGQPPFTGDQPVGVLHSICHKNHLPATKVNPMVPAALSGLVDRLLIKNPSRRIQSADELLQQLSKVDLRPNAKPRLTAKALFVSSAFVVAIASISFLFRPLREMPQERIVPLGSYVQKSDQLLEDEMQTLQGLVVKQESRQTRFLHATPPWSEEITDLREQVQSQSEFEELISLKGKRDD